MFRYSFYSTLMAFYFLQVTIAQKAFNLKQYGRLTSCIAKKSSAAKKQMVKETARSVRKELPTFLDNGTNALRQLTPPTIASLRNFDLARVVEEAERDSPAFTTVLRAALCVNKAKRHLIIPTMGTIIAIIGYLHRPISMAGFQQLNAIEMWLSGCKREV